MTPLEEYLNLIDDSKPTMYGSQLGDEKLWVANSIGLGDVIKFFHDPHKWVHEVSDERFCLPREFVVHFQMAEEPAFVPAYLISGIDNTAVVTIRTSQRIVIENMRESLTRDSMLSNLRHTAGRFQEAELLAMEQVTGLGDELYHRLLTCQPQVDIVCSPEDRRGYGHSEIFQKGDPCRKTLMPVFLTGCATDHRWLNACFCHKSNTVASVIGRDNTVQDVYYFNPLTSDAQLNSIGFLYQATANDSQPACEYGSGTLANTSSYGIDMTMSVTKDY